MDCPKCGKHGKFSKLTDMPAFQCSWCAYRIHPMVGTPFEKSRTPLQKWFYAMYLFTTSRHGVPAKELERQLGVTYKCAWRMGHEIRKYMTKLDGDNGSFGGHVEADETFIGGKKKVGKFGKGPTKSEIMASKAVVFGVVERGGDVQTYVIPSRSREHIEPMIDKHVPPGTTISTDEFGAYRYLGAAYNHGTVYHEAEMWVNGIHHTNTIEAFWSRLKNSIRGTHVHVSKKHLAKYLGEFEYRYNMRGVKAAFMFDRLLVSF
jgi:transposase-like protein